MLCPWACMPPRSGDNIFSSEVQSRHLGFLRFLIKARHGTCRWTLLHELGQKPFHFYWWKSVLKFWDKLTISNSCLLRDVVQSDLALARDGCHNCWSGEVLAAIRSLPAIATGPDLGRGMQAEEDFMRMGEMDNSEVLERVTAHYASFWRPFEEVDSWRTDGVLHRKTATYCKLFKGQGVVFPKLPKYQKQAGVPYFNVLRCARFRVGSHHLQVERGRFRRLQWASRVCTRCERAFFANLPEPRVDDEFHMIFECQAFSHLRDDTVQTLHALADGSVRNFAANKDVCTVYNVISDCMKIVDDEVVPAAEAPPAE